MQSEAPATDRLLLFVVQPELLVQGPAGIPEPTHSGWEDG
jgi:hypothetical protein